MTTKHYLLKTTNNYSRFISAKKKGSSSLVEQDCLMLGLGLILMRINALITEKTIQRGKKEKILASVELMQKEPGTILKWSKEAWMAMVESAVIHKDKTLSFKFYCGRTINV